MLAGILSVKPIRGAALAALVGLPVACSDAPVGPSPVPIPARPPVVAATLRGTVDLVSGTMTFDYPRPAHDVAGAASVISPAIYGNQGVTVRLYNSSVVVTNPSAPGKKRFTANVGVRNLLPHPIGDEQGGLIPADTSGIFVFMNQAPVVRSTSSPCAPACVVTVADGHGVGAFTAPAHAYWHWTDRLAAVGAGRDTTLVRRSWSFEADSQVVSFSFDVLVSAAWPAPYQTRWKIDFPGDSFPHTASEPRWTQLLAAGGGTIAHDGANPGSVLLTAPSNGAQSFLRRDSVAATTPAYIEARLIVNSANVRPEIGLAIDDNVRYVAIGVSGTRVGFVNDAFNFIGPSVTTSPKTFQTYRLRKFGADSAQLLVNGIRVDSRPYSDFSLSLIHPTSLFQFGAPGLSPGGNSSTWDYVTYEIGATEP